MLPVEFQAGIGLVLDHLHETSRIVDILQQFDDLAAEKFIKRARSLDQIVEMLERLADEPELGERRDDLGQNLRAFVVRTYVIFYHPAADGIHVARIVHGARDFPAMFQS